MDMKADVQLLREFVAGESSAFEELVVRHQGMVLGVCQRVTGGAAYSEDAAQATLLQLALRAEKLQSHPSIAGWLHRTAVNVSKTSVRSDVRRRRREELAMEEIDNSTECESDQRAAFREVLDKALVKLPEQDRECLVLHYIEGIPQTDLAQHLGLKESAIGMRIMRARDRLRKVLRRLGLALSGTAVVLLLGSPLTVEAGVGFTTAVVGAGMQVQVAGLAGVSCASSPVIALTKGVMKAMFIKKLQMVAASVAAVVLIGSVAYSQSREVVRPQPEPWLAQTRRAPKPMPPKAKKAAKTPPKGSRAINLGKKDKGKTVNAALNDLIIIELTANPSTGYGWSGDALPKDSILKFKSKKHETASQRNAEVREAPGMPGVTTFAYQVARTGSGKITLNYRRPWEKNTKPAKTYTVTIKASAKASPAATGAIKFRQAPDLKKISRIVVSIRNTALMDGPAPLIGTVELKPPFKMPIRYSIPYDAAKVRPNPMFYSVSARVYTKVGGKDKLYFINDTRHNIFTKPGDTKRDVEVKKVR